MAAPPPQNLPYDYLFKVLIIGDASVGKVRLALFHFPLVKSIIIYLTSLSLNKKELVVAQVY